MIGTEWFDLAEVENDPTFMLAEASVSHALYACSSSKSAVFADKCFYTGVRCASWCAVSSGRPHSFGAEADSSA